MKKSYQQYYEYYSELFKQQRNAGNIRAAWQCVEIIATEWRRETCTRFLIMPVMRWPDMADFIQGLAPTERKAA